MPMNRIAHIKSSSTQVALLVSAILAVTLVLLCDEIYSLMHGERVDPLFTSAILGLMALISIGLFTLSYYVTKRINTIAATADLIITTRDLSQRIPIDSRWDDLSTLSSILNLMLEDIEQLVAGVRQVSDNIAHDLRTPLTRLRNHTESLRASGKPIKPEQLNPLILECDGLLTTFNALLRIANIEAGKRHSGFHTVNLGNVMDDVIDLYEPLAGEKSVHLTLDRQCCTIMGDKDMLFQAMANLVDNAIKYTPQGGTVAISVRKTKNGGQIVIRDTGHGIPDAHKQQVFRRFYRVDSCRVQPGSGLGLSLVAAVIKLHQGEITLTDNAPTGLIVTVTL